MPSLFNVAHYRPKCLTVPITRRIDWHFLGYLNYGQIAFLTLKICMWGWGWWGPTYRERIITQGPAQNENLNIFGGLSQLWKIQSQRRIHWWRHSKKHIQQNTKESQTYCACTLSKIVLNHEKWGWIEKICQNLKIFLNLKNIPESGNKPESYRLTFKIQLF